MLGQKVMVRMESRWKELCCAPPSLGRSVALGHHPEREPSASGDCSFQVFSASRSLARGALSEGGRGCSRGSRQAFRSAPGKVTLAS